MPAAQPHPEEASRQRALDRLGLLDTDPEAMFDSIVELVSELLDVPITLLSFVDKDRQWFKSRIGIEITETDRCHAFCAHAILDASQPLIVEDATTDPRFLDNHLVTGEAAIRFYAGVTIQAPDCDLPLGTLCVIDQKPRQISAKDLEILKKLAKQVEHLLAMRALAISKETMSSALVESEALVRGIIDNSQTFVGLLKPDGTLIDANRPALEAANVDVAEVFGKPFWKTPWWDHSKDLQERLRMAILRAASGRADRFEATHPIGNGKAIDVDFSLSPIVVNGKVVYLVPEGRDITLLKQRERESARYLASLEETNNDLKQFAYIASHDLRSPLRGIAQVTSFIEEDEEDNISEASKGLFQKIRTRIQRMDRLLDDLLAYARVDRSAKPPMEFSSGDLVSEIMEMLTIPDGFNVQVPANMPALSGHATPLRQVLLNLISNAIKHHDKDAGQITLTVADRAEFFEFRVTDDGPGIEQKYHEQIFEMFKTLKSKDSVEGSGMGLAIIQKMVRRYGGKVAVESTPGNGTTFAFTWPKELETDAN